MAKSGNGSKGGGDLLHSARSWSRELIEAHVLRPIALRQFSPDLKRSWVQVYERGLTYMTRPQMSSLLALCGEMEERHEPGIMIECGCARGGSAILLTAEKSEARVLRIYDVFGALPEPSPKDGEDLRARWQQIQEGHASELGGTHYSHEPDLLARVRSAFVQAGYPPERNNVTFVKGKVQDTLALDERVCLAHIDVDFYEAVQTCLERIVPNLSSSGAIVVHAYLDWSSSRRAVDDFFRGRPGWRFDTRAGHLVARRERAC
jgi:O-methyltransferase